MANEFKLSFTAAEIDEKLGKVDTLGGNSAQSDWNQTDSSAADFIKNKPFGEGEGYILPEQEVPYDPDQEACVAVIDGEINGGDTVTVVYDGVSYVCNAVLLDGMVFFGNLSFMDLGDDTGEPFAGCSISNAIAFLTSDTDSHVIGIISKIVKKLPSEYMEVRSFYVSISGNDPYIYTDATLSNKATKEEIIATAKIQNFRLAMAFAGAAVIAMPVLSVPIIDQSDFKVYALRQQSGNIEIYRTAEYVPEG